MNSQKSRRLFLFVLNACAVSALGIIIASSVTLTAYADDTLGTITVNPPPCPIGQVRVWGDGSCQDLNSLVVGNQQDGSGYPGQVGGGGGGGSSISPAQKALAKKCASTYGSYNGHSGPNPSYTTQFLDSYGWSSSSGGAVVQTVITPTHLRPSMTPRCNGGAWGEDEAVTIRPGSGACPPSPTDLDSSTTYVFMAAYISPEELMAVLAHEWAHEWGADESQAQQVENATKQAYEKDSGAKCMQ